MTRSFMAGTALACAIALPAHAQVPQQVSCGPRGDILHHLGERYGERTVGIGLAHSGLAIEVLVNPAQGSWSLLATSPTGVACFMATGENWQSTGEPATATAQPIAIQH